MMMFLEGGGEMNQNLEDHAPKPASRDGLAAVAVIILAVALIAFVVMSLIS